MLGKALALILVATSLLPPHVHARDLCDELGVCVSDPCALLADGCGPTLVDGCRFDAFWVSGAVPVDGCAAGVTLSSCEVEWLGGHGLWSARVTCAPIATLP